MKTLYLHIGTPKTGTKSIQHFCWENGEALGKYGYCYPDLHELCPGYTLVKNGRFLVDEIPIEDEEELKKATQEKYKQGMDILVKLFDEYDNIILSDEGIYRATYKRRASLWQELKEDGEKYGFTVKIVVYFRRQDEYMASLWNQNIKTNSGINPQITWEEYSSVIPRNRQLNYFRKLESIAAVLGRENIIVRRFERGAFLEDSIYADFLNAVGLKLTDEFNVSKEQRNPGLGGNTHEFMRILNGVDDLSEKDRKFIRSILFADGEISKVQYPTAMFSEKECKKFLSNYKISNRRVVKEYMGEGNGDLFTDTIPELPKWTVDNPYMMQDIIRFSAIGMAYLRRENEKIQKENVKLRKSYNNLKKEVDSLKKALPPVNE